MHPPALQANIDQHAAYLRDWFDTIGVNPHDPDERRALMAAWLILERHHEHGTSRIGFATLAQVIHQS